MNNNTIKAVAEAICLACDENPNHHGDCRGNEKRWQDYVPIAKAAIEVMQIREMTVDEAQRLIELSIIRHSKTVKSEDGKFFIPHAMTSDSITDCSESIVKTLVGFQQPAVREMTVKEVASFLRDIVKAAPIGGSAYISMAEALAKLGTIRIVE